MHTKFQHFLLVLSREKKGGSWGGGGKVCEGLCPTRKLGVSAITAVHTYTNGVPEFFYRRCDTDIQKRLSLSELTRQMLFLSILCAPVRSNSTYYKTEAGTVC